MSNVSWPVAAMMPENPPGRALARLAVMLTGLMDRCVLEELAVCRSASSPAKPVAARLATQIQPQTFLRRGMAKMDWPTSQRK